MGSAGAFFFSFQHRGGESGKSPGVMAMVHFSFQCEGQPVGGVCMWARTDNPATLHSQQ